VVRVVKVIVIRRSVFMRCVSLIGCVVVDMGGIFGWLF